MTNHPNRSRKLSIGDRVEGGKGDDRDTGHIVAIFDMPMGSCDVEVAWDSGVKTPAVAADLRRA